VGTYVAIDPGVHTGVAVFDGAFDAFIVDDHREVADWFEDVSPVADALFLESFHLSAATVKKTQAGSLLTIELIGVLRHIARRNGVRVYMQSPADRMFSSDAKLAALGWETPANPDHARSAARHLLLGMVRVGEIPPERFLLHS